MDQQNELLSEDELDWLDAFLLYRADDDEAETWEGEVDEGILGIAELDGFLTAIVSGPHTIEPSKWLPAVWGDFEPEWESPAELEKVFSLMVRHMNDIADMLNNSPQEFAPIFMEREVEGEKHLVVDEWCAGYLRGVSLDEASWHAEEIARQFDLILLFGAESGWEAQEQMNPDEVEKQQAQIPAAVRAIHAYWHARRGK